MRDGVPACTSAWYWLGRGGVRFPERSEVVAGTILGPAEKNPRRNRMPDAAPPVGEQYANYPSLRGRAVLVTGGATGIGASIVAHFARQGARLAFFDVQDELAAELIASLRAEGA